MSSRKTGEGGPETVVYRHCEAAHTLPPVEPQVLREPRVNPGSMMTRTMPLRCTSRKATG